MGDVFTDLAMADHHDRGIGVFLVVHRQGPVLHLCHVGAQAHQASWPDAIALFRTVEEVLGEAGTQPLESALEPRAYEQHEQFAVRLPAEALPIYRTLITHQNLLR